MFPPDGLLTSGQTKYHVKLDPHIIAPDPFASDDCLDDFLPVHQLLLNPIEELNTMNPGADEPSSGLNGRLRPRKSNVPSPQNTKSPRRSEAGTSQDKVKRTNTPSKTPPNKPDDLATKSDTTYLCPYCDRKFASKQTLSKHARRMHGSSSKQDSFIACLFCNHYEAEANNIVHHMAESHPQQYFACLNCHTRYPSSSQLEEHKIKTCDLKLPYRSKLRQKVSSSLAKETQSVLNISGKDDFGKTNNVFSDGHGFNGIVISCEPSQVRDGADIEDNITTNLILPPCKSLGGSTVLEKNAVIVLDDIHWNKRIPPNFSFHNTDADQILSRLGVVHRSPRTGESSKRDWKTIDDSTQKFEKCFDTSFYSKVASNVQENLSKFLDGSFNFNPDPDSTIKTRKSKNSVQINTAEGFPILLASEQYSRNAFDRYMPRAIAPKHKWKWDNLESEKSPINPDQIQRDSHTNNCIITLVSSLDIWTQLRMRSKFEEKFGCPPLEKKTEKQAIISNELKDILESRELPAVSSQVVKVTNQPSASIAAEFPASLGLSPSTSRAAPAAAVLSGEWVRPRCYVCCACGEQSRDSRLASTHASTHHPNAQVQHYEIVGEQLLNADILKHLYVPPGQMCNRTRPLRGFRECTKCSKSITLEDLHQHMLDCAGDTPAVRRKCRYRPFGVRRRRPRQPDNTIRKKIRKDIRTRQTRTKKSLLRPRPIRTEVGDAETIRKMIADLPAKRHRVPINPSNTSLRPRIKQRSNLLIKGRSSEDYNKRKRGSNKDVAITDTESPVKDGTSTKSDEDKPLKPKVKRMASKTVQRTDSEKRNTMTLKRPKRKRLQVNEVEKNDNNKNASNPKSVTTEELSLENSPEKIDIHNVDFKAREHVGRGNSSNRDGQRPGCSGHQNGNSQNQCAPVQNVPLKHSIARLTADSEKHDKSVQFHHLFLVQQECNNVNQHVHSGQELLFENEAAVLTLDKPPLHSSSKTSQDYQKNKLNKPRKGLNACIAMLKNKLVEPTANSGTIPTGHVSVQCGDDEPLYIKPDTTLRAPSGLDRKVDQTVQQEHMSEKSLNTKTAPSTRPRRTGNLEKKVSCNHSDSNSRHQKPSTSSGHVIKQKPQNTVATRESSRRKPLISEPKIIEVTTQLHLIPQKDNTGVASSSKIISTNRLPTAVNAPTHKANLQSVVSTHKDNQPNVATAKPGELMKPNEKQQSVSHMALNKPCDLTIEETEAHGDVIPSHQASTDVNDTANRGQSNDYENCFTVQQQTSLNSDCDSSNKIVPENYPDSDFHHLTVNIRPAHASTNVESMVAIPLDLSGKMSNIINTQELSSHENAYVLRNSFETYETLDLSNKNQDVGYRANSENMTMNNEIVDLSVKASTSRSTEVEVTRKDDVTEISLENIDNDVPTDLTVKKKGTKPPTKVVTAKTQNNEPSLYKEAVNNRSQQIENEIAFKSPTNLSVKETKSDSINMTLGATKAIDTEKASKGNPAHVVDQLKSRNVVPFLGEKPEETSEKISNNLSKESNTAGVRNVLLKDTSLSISQITESVRRKTRDDKKNAEHNSQAIVSRTYDKMSVQVQKPIYDPTLKIPQYRIRAASTVDAPANTNLPTNTSSSIVHSITPPTCGIFPDYTAEAVIPNQDVFTTTSMGLPSIGIQERTSYGSAVPLNVTNSSTGSMFNITNCGIPAQLSKFESTTPVYTLGNTCISLTRIESPNSITLTNTLLTSETTIANTTPVYTLAGTTMGVAAKYSQILPTSPPGSLVVNDPAERCSILDKKEEFNIPSTSSKNTDHNKEISTSQNFTNVANPLMNTEHDPETARKIALLPKELVEILGNMPVDHRNQLLNVLPQYVSTPTSVTSLHCDITKYTESNNSITLLQTSDQTEIAVPSVVNSVREPEPKQTSPLVVTQEENEHMRTLKSVSQHNFDNKSPIPALTSHTSLTLHAPIHLDENAKTEETFTIQQLQNTKEEAHIELSKVNSDLSPRDSFSILTSNRLSLCHKSSTNKVIDLTEDEIVSRMESHGEPPLEVSPQISLIVQPKRNKPSNDQTASLRAVRIKAPSERKKSIDNQLVKQTAPAISNKMSIEQDNEVKKSLHVNVSLNTDITLAIQQAEVSSTQHSNKNVVSECKFASAISPNVQECNETNNCTSRRKSSLDVPKDETTKNYEIQDTSKSIAKATLVTSSIVNNARECIAADDKSCNSLSSEFSNIEYLSNVVVPSESSDFHKDKHNLTMESTLHTTLDTTKPYDIPIQCPTPNVNPVLDKLKDPTMNESSSNICEEEDSDDDLSLAVICQQKQKHLLRKDLTTDERSKKKESDCINKKAKKSKKKLGIRNTGGDLSTEKTSCNNNTVSPIPLDKNCLLKDKEAAGEGPMNCAGMDKKVNNTDQSIKKKTSYRYQESVDTNSNSKYKILSSTYTKCDANDKVAKTKNNKNLKLSSSEHEKADFNTAIKDETNDFVETSQKHPGRDNMDITNASKLQPEEVIVLSIHSTTPDRQKNKKKKRLLGDIPQSGRTHEHRKDSMSEPSNNKVTESNEITGTDLDVNKIVLQQTENSKKYCSEKDPQYFSCDSMQSKDTTITDHGAAVCDVSLTLGSKPQDIENISIPARRSRRGKSLSNSVEDEDTLQHMETLQENRTPLTKKQLIFSKLLLDEENNIKQPEGITSSKAIVSEIVETENVSVENVAVDKNKPTKRKKSPHLKRKCKKKKSLNDINCPNESNPPLLSQAELTQTEPCVESKDRKLSEQTLSHECRLPSELISKNFSTVDTEISTVNKNVIVILEKRKSGDAGMEESQSSQPKKSKLGKTDSRSDFKTTCISESKIDEDSKIPETNSSLSRSIVDEKISYDQTNILPKRNCDRKEFDNNIPNQKGMKVNDTDLRVKTCYNTSVAGRRTRSKSAVIKSAVYDPYDIDLDDMIESAEPLRQRKTSSDQRLPNNTKHITSFKKIKELGLVMRSDSEQKILSNISDSDDSTKSDVPLKKYAEEKGKKISKLDESVYEHKNDAEHDAETGIDSTGKQDYFIEKRNKQTFGVTKTGDGATQDDTEEQLRSEQFMESFGFFSERKPRKSNLLATKKISETFHIIANECDDMYFGFKDKSYKKTMQNENRKSIEKESNLKATRQRSPPPKKNVKRGRKKKTSTVTVPSYCHICKKEFRRADNYLRHQMSLLHVSKLSEVEMKVKTVPIQEEPNYLLAYKEHLDRMKAITDKMTKRKKNSKSAPKIIPLTLEEILADVNKIVREQQLSQRGLSCDEELFLDCCELLKESHKKPDHGTDIPSASQDNDNMMCSSQTDSIGLDFLGKSNVDTKCDSKNDGDVDSITAKTILESEEVRNLENDLISGLKEAANASNLKSNIVFQHGLDEDTDHREQHQDFVDNFSSPTTRESYDHEPLDNYEESEDHNNGKTRKYPEFKEKMYPDIEEIDMFEDKFDKIKRKCRSQAAAAKQTPLVVEPSTSRKGRKKSEKKKGKKNLKKIHPSAVLTKGALKGFDGIKVSIPTSDINISAIVSPLEHSHKRRKKLSSKKRRDIKNSELSRKCDSHHQPNERSASSKNVDVYEFMDNEDVELFEFRPSTLMERFKSISNKETPSTSRVMNPVVEEVENSSASASDGDDFVYMSDDYVCSDDETENSLMSCNVSNTKIVSDVKKLATQMKRRDVIEKNAVMGKIFKNNAVRSERKVIKSKEPVKPKANLDQLFDSLLEDEPSSSMLNDESLSLKDEVTYVEAYGASSPIQADALSAKYSEQCHFKQIEAACPGKENYSLLKQKRSIDNDDVICSLTNKGPPTCKITMKSLMGEHRSIKHRKRHSSPQEYKSVSPNKYDTTASKQLHLSKKIERKSPHQENFSEYHEITSKNDDCNELCDQSVSDETGVARQRARRKCTVGKQNVLAESWSSESEPDGGPPRPRSAESTVSATPRKKKVKKKDGQHTGGRRCNNRHNSFKKQDIESRVTSSNRNTTTHTSGASYSVPVENRSAGMEDATSDAESGQEGAGAGGGGGAVFVPPAAPSASAGAPAAPRPSTSAAAAAGPAPGPGAGPGLGPGEPVAAPDDDAAEGGRFRTLFFWTAEGAAHEQQLRQQHGWIVGDSHKKLVTMLAQAKRRKRNNDDKRHLVE